jgi:uncharacterized protein YodC (DUF2158 family)
MRVNQQQKSRAGSSGANTNGWQNMTKARPVKIGDTVHLRCRSIAMAVESFRRDGHVICVWIDKLGRVHRAAFSSGALIIDHERANLV